MTAERRKRSVLIPRPLLAAVVLAAFALGVFVDRGFLIVTGSAPDDTDSRAGVPLVQGGRDLSAVKKTVTAMVKQRLAEGEATRIAFYYYDFRANSEFGIDENVKFFPHSLLKLPVMMVYFKQAETNPDLLGTRLAYTTPSLSPQPPLIKPLRTVKRGSSYSIQDLIYRMLVYEDDGAFTLLASRLPGDALDRLYADLSLEYDPNSDDDPMSLKDYATFYRALVNGTYLNRKMSSKALDYLSQSSFRNGLVAGIPPNVRIASRFGAHIVSDEQGKAPRDLFQLHEVGIVYYPNHPFLLGVSIEGDDLARMERTVRDIGSLVYREVDSAQKERTP